MIQDSLKQFLLNNVCKHYWVGFSGGVDSTVLLHAMSQLNLPVTAIHIHHGLSHHADTWVEHCKTVCQQLNIPLVVEHVEVDVKRNGLEQGAREARYQVFEQHVQKDHGLVLGHHSDDQIETFMIRLMRGSGLTGLSAMDDSREFKQGKMLRPLLNVSREQIEHYAQQQGLQWIEDDSNTNTELDRNWWRHDLLPTLYARYPQAAQSILKSVSVLQDEHSLLNELVLPIYREVVDEKQRLDINKLSRQKASLQYQIIRLWLEKNQHYPLLSDKQIQVLLKDFIASRDDAEPVFRWAGNEIRRHTGKLYIMEALPEPSTDWLEMPPTGKLQLTWGELTIERGKGLRAGNYQIKPYDGSLKAKPVGRPTKVLKKWFQEFSIPPWQRPYWPIIMVNEQVVAVPGLFICEGFLSELGLSLTYISR